MGTAYSTVSLPREVGCDAKEVFMDRKTRLSIALFVFAATTAGFAQSGFHRYSAGAVKTKVAATQTASTIFSEDGWTGLPSAVLQAAVPAGGSDLFNVSFSAECRLAGAGVGDYVRIRVVDTVTIGGVFVSRMNLEPYDAGQAFCSADGLATHKGNWVRRAGEGMHTLVVQFSIVDTAPDDDLRAWIDDWTFELVVHE
jgi:hypothetical protein